MDYSAIAHEDNGGFGSPDPAAFSPHPSGPTHQVHDSSASDSTFPPPIEPQFGALPEDEEQGRGFMSPNFRPAEGPPLDDDDQHPHQPSEEADEQAGNAEQQTEGGPSGEQRRPQRYHGNAPQHPAQNQRPPPQYRLQAKITGLERTGRKDPILRFDVHTNLPKFRTTQFRDVRRTHPEFQKLATHLLSANPECVVPAVPPPSTSAGVGTDEDETRVRAMMQRWLNTICSNEVLMRDEEMIFFVEADFGYSPIVRRKQPATGVRRKVIKQFAPPPDDTPELAEARPVVKAFYLGTMETGQKLDRVIRSRRGLGLAETALGTALATLASTESHAGLSNALRKLGRTVQSVGDFHAAQATAEAATLMDPLNYHSADAFIVKETLTNRQILMRELANARKELTAKTQTAEVLRAKGNIRRDKVDEALAALDEAKATEHGLDGKVRRVTGNLVLERRRWFARTAKDMRAAIRDHTLRQIEAERRTLATLESVRPDVRAIDSSGGLSRLGRDVPPNKRRASLAASQGPRGDAWSGVPRAAGVQREFSAGGVPPVVKAEQKIQEESDEGDRLDAKNAAGALAGSTF